jgi:hypothetical protein
MRDSAAWRYGSTRGCKLEGRMTCLGADMQQVAACRKDEGTRACGGVCGSEAHRERRVACPREKQPSSGLRIGQSHGSEARGSREEGGGLVGGGGARDWGDAICAPSGDAGVPAGHHGGKHLSGLDRFRVRRRYCVRVQRSHRRTLSTKSDGTRSEQGARRRYERRFSTRAKPASFM